MADVELEVQGRKWIPGYEPISGSAMHPRRKAALVGLATLAVFCVVTFGGLAVYRSDSASDVPYTPDNLQSNSDAFTSTEAEGVEQPVSKSHKAHLNTAAVCTNTLKSGSITLPTSGRKFELFVDANLAANELHPIVLIWHGLSGSVADIEESLKFRQEADAANWILAYPISGTGFPAAFNGKGCCDKNGPDDVAYAKEIITYLERTMCADGHKVFSTGFSNGGFMTHKLACDAGLRDDGHSWIRAAAPHSGLIGEYPSTALPPAAQYPNCNPPVPVPIISFHGTTDGTVKYNGVNPNPFSSAKWYSFEDTKLIWKRANKCSDAAPLLSNPTSTSRCEVYADCAVTWCHITGLAHAWATQPTHVDATDQTIAFFLNYS